MEEAVSLYLSVNVDRSHKQSLLGYLSGILNDSKAQYELQWPSSRGLGKQTGMKTIIVIFYLLSALVLRICLRLKILNNELSFWWRRFQASL